jgi:hypothetical protein
MIALTRGFALREPLLTGHLFPDCGYATSPEAHMKVEQRTWNQKQGWQPQGDGGAGSLNGGAQLVLAFGSTQSLRCGGRMNDLRVAYPGARVIGCSTAGEICGTRVTDESIVATAVDFDHTEIRTAQVSIDASNDSRAAGRSLGKTLSAADLVHVLVISDGLRANGSDLVAGLTESLPPGVAVTGGLAGDGADFKQTLVGHDGTPVGGAIVAVGFYGNRLKVGYGSLGGWDAFGPERRITRSAGNVLYELDGQSALGIYKKYLGEHAAGLPASGLLFPLTLRTGPDETPVVRTILAVDEAKQCMTFAGDVPQGAFARLMKANFERLIEGATGAARASVQGVGASDPQLAILISCVGRKLILKQRTEEEVEGVRSVLGAGAALTGFYSYGEIAPFTAAARSELHNQTMTVTTFSEN